MTTSPESPGQQPDEKSGRQSGRQPDVDELEAELEAKRRRLGETVDVLSERLDVRARAQQGIADARTEVMSRLRDPAGRPTPVAYAAAAGVVAVVGLVVLRWRRGR